MEKQLSDIKSNAVMEPDYTLDNLWCLFNPRKANFIPKLQFMQTLNSTSLHSVGRPGG